MGKKKKCCGKFEKKGKHCGGCPMGDEPGEKKKKKKKKEKKKK